jgi:hypothetical protein
MRTIMRHVRLAALGGLLALGAGPVAAGEDDPVDYVGSLDLVGTRFCPSGSVEAAGQILSISGYDAVFAIIGATYGGDGQTTFALPDLRSKSPIEGSRYCIWLQGLFPQPP